MAGDWIKMRSNLASDPRVMSMAGDLGLHPLDIVGRLHAVWSWADSHSLDGNAICVSTSSLDDIAGQTSGFAKALQDVGWLEVDGKKLTFPRFDEHNGSTAKRRAQTAKRVARHAANAKLTQEALPREEKSREEKKKSTKRKAFVPPSAQELDQYAKEYAAKNAGWPLRPFDAEDFIDHYESNGWKVGRNQMKDWRAAARNWGKRKFGRGGDETKDTARRIG